MLLRGGSSLGGARPKARVIDVNGRAAIAKSPSVSGDEWDVTAWEAGAIALARRTGMRVPAAELHQINGKQSCLRATWLARSSCPGIERGKIVSLTLAPAELLAMLLGLWSGAGRYRWVAAPASSRRARRVSATDHA